MESLETPLVPIAGFTDAMESVVDRVLSPIEICVQKGMDAMDSLCLLFNNDAMYVITEYIEPIRTYGQPEHDCMDILVETNIVHMDAMEAITGYTELKSHYGQPLQDGLCVLVETPELPYVLVQPSDEVQLKHCSVQLSRIDTELSFLPKKDICSAIMNAGR